MAGFLLSIKISSVNVPMLPRKANYMAYVYLINTCRLIFNISLEGVS